MQTRFTVNKGVTITDDYKRFVLKPKRKLRSHQPLQNYVRLDTFKNFQELNDVYFDKPDQWVEFNGFQY